MVTRWLAVACLLVASCAWLQRGPGVSPAPSDRAGSPAAATIRLSPAAYLRIREASPAAQFVDRPLYVGASADGVDVSLVRYDLGDVFRKSIRRAALVFSAGQTCRSSWDVSPGNCGVALGVEAHRIQVPWDMRTTTWASFHEVPSPYDPSPAGKIGIAVPLGETYVYSLDVTDAMLAGDGSGLGFALMGDAAGRRTGEDQKDSIITPPVLEVTYSE